MNTPQPGILLAVPRLARYLSFSCGSPAMLRAGLNLLCDLADGERAVVGIGRSLVLALGARIDGLRDFPRHAGAGFDVPSTPGALWIWLRGDDRGEILHRSRRIEQALAPAFRLEASVDAFLHDGGRDLTGYEDGTENPKGELAREVAAVHGGGAALEGSSFAAVQQWVHDFASFDAMSPPQQDNSIGRRRTSNEEIGDAPPTAHVKRTAQESFTPAAFVLRRSMPWAEGMRAGLMFVSFGASFDAFEALLGRMVGAEDGIADALFGFTRPVSGAYYWCPGMRDGRLDLGALGL